MKTSGAKGVTLVEALIALGLMSVVFATVFAFYSSSSSNYRNQESAQFYQRASQSLLSSLRRDLRCTNSIQMEAGSQEFLLMSSRLDETGKVIKDTVHYQWGDIKVERLSQSGSTNHFNFANQYFPEDRFELAFLMLTQKSMQVRIEVLSKEGEEKFSLEDRIVLESLQ